MPADKTCGVCERALPEQPAVDAQGRLVCVREACLGARRRLPLRQRLFAHVERTDNCWLWTGAKNASGAGILHIREHGRVRQIVAPRLSWELHNGLIPDGYRVWHNCWQSSCVRPDHLYLRRRTRVRTPAASSLGPPAPSIPLDPPRRFASGRIDDHRTWWTRERVLVGLRRFHEKTGEAPVTSILWDHLSSDHGRRRQPWRHRFPSSYAVLRYFPTFRAAWEANGVQLADRRQAPWTATEDWYVSEAIGVLPTATIATDLGRSESAIHARVRHLKRHITDAWGWPLQRVVQKAGVSEYALRGYIRRGELSVFKGAKCVYIDPADLLVVDEIDWAQPQADLEAAVLRSLRWRLVQVLAGGHWRRIRPQSTLRSTTMCNPLQRVARTPRPSCFVPGVRACVFGPAPAMPQQAGRIGIVERLYWSVNSRQHGPAQWRAKVVFARAYRRGTGSTIAYCLPVNTLQLLPPIDLPLVDNVPLVQLRPVSSGGYPELAKCVCARKKSGLSPGTWWD